MTQGNESDSSLEVGLLEMLQRIEARLEGVSVALQGLRVDLEALGKQGARVAQRASRRIERPADTAERLKADIEAFVYTHNVSSLTFPRWHVLFAYSNMRAARLGLKTADLLTELISARKLKQLVFQDTKRRRNVIHLVATRAELNSYVQVAIAEQRLSPMVVVKSKLDAVIQARDAQIERELERMASADAAAAAAGGVAMGSPGRYEAPLDTGDDI